MDYTAEVMVAGGILLTLLGLTLGVGIIVLAIGLDRRRR